MHSLFYLYYTPINLYSTSITLQMHQSSFLCLPQLHSYWDELFFVRPKCLYKHNFSFPNHERSRSLLSLSFLSLTHIWCLRMSDHPSQPLLLSWIWTFYTLQFVELVSLLSPRAMFHVVRGAAGTRHAALEVEARHWRCGVPSSAGKGSCAPGEQGGSLSDGIAVGGHAAP